MASTAALPLTAAGGSEGRRRRLEEPAVALSDLALFVVAGTGAARLLLDLAIGALEAPVLWAWTVAYLAMAVAALAGFAYHGFGRRLAAKARESLWSLTLASLGVVAFAMLMSVALLVEDPAITLLLSTVAVARFVGYLSRLRSRRDFGYAIREYAFGLAGVALAAFDLWARGEPAASWLLGAVAVAVAAAVIQRAGFSSRLGLDANTLFHVVQIVSLLLALHGVRLFGSPAVLPP